MIEHKRKSTYILWLLIPSLALVVARSFVHTNGRALDSHQVSKTHSATSRSEQITVRVAGRGNPYLNLRDGHDLLTTYVGTAAPVRILQQDQAHPTSLASADFDEDGVPDLVSGYSSPGGGLLALYRGNMDSIYPNAPEARRHKAEGSFVDSPFFPSARIFEGPEAADFIEAGDFDGDGHWDVVTAARGSALLQLFSGNGRGDLKLTRSIQLPGTVTAVGAGEVNRRDGLTDLAVGILGPAVPQVIVFESPLGALRGEPEAFSVPTEVTAIAMGQLDDEYTMDLAVGAGSELLIIHGRDRKLSLEESERNKVRPGVTTKHSFESTIISTALGDFTGKNRKEIAVLLSNREVKLISFRRGKGRQLRQNNLLLQDNWNESAYLVRAKVSSLPQDDLVLVDKVNHQIHILGGEKEKESTERVATSLQIDNESVAVLPMQLNVDALQDLVILKKGQNNLTVAVTAPMSTFVVNSTGDGSDCDLNDGVCSLGTFVNGQCVLTNGCTLRAAIQQANASADLDAISFAIGSGQQTITPLSGLPDINNGPVIIDGTTQPGFSGTPIIELSGASAPGNQIGLTIATSNNTIRGLVINGFKRYYGILFYNSGGTTTGNKVEGNFIGTDVKGTAALGNFDGVGIYGFNNTIGGTTSAARNIISGNQSGVYLSSGSGDNETGNKVEGNFIGTDVTGNADLGNDFSGLYTFAANNTIGGTSPGTRNIISGNGTGIYVSSAGGNIIQNNYIGTDVTGTADLGNAGTGVYMPSTNTLIGGTSISARNIISGNSSFGVRIPGIGTGNQLLGNYIGTNADGTGELGNGDHGVLVEGSNNTIGGVSPDSWNKIQNNGGDGVYVNFGRGNGIVGNSIFGNTGLGIDLGADGVTSNDSGDVDSGANDLQNFPLLTSATSSSGKATIRGTLNSKPSTAFTVAVYSNSQCDPSGFGEGEAPVSSSTVTTDASGNANFIITSSSSLPIGDSVAATATDPTGNTSEFSRCLSVCPIPPINPITDPVAIQFENGNTLDTTHLSSAMQTAYNSFRNAVTNNGGQFILNSAYRPSSYQVHLREVWDKWQLLKNCTLPACQTLRTQVQTEVDRHGISNLITRPAGVCGFHTQGLAIDVAVNPAQTGLPLQTTLNFASQSGLYRRISAKDPVHFELFPPQPLNCPPQLNALDEAGVVEYSSGNSQATQNVGANVLVTITKQFVNNKYVYTYEVQNNDPRPILAFEVGYDDSTNASRLLIPPVGWNYETGLAAGSTASPTDWSSKLITTEESEFHSIEWRTENPNQNIQPLQSMSGFSTVLPQDDDTYGSSSVTVVFADGTKASGQIAPARPELLLDTSGPALDQAAALDSLLFVRDPFPVVNGADFLNLGVDRNTRVIIFLTNFQFAQSETSSSVVVNLIDSNNQTYDIAAEDVRQVPNFQFTQVIFRLPNDLATGTCTIKIKAHGQISNAGTIRIRT